MKVKVTSLLLVGGAFAVATLTQDSSPNLLAGSPVLTVLIMVAWFAVMGAALYFWAKHSRQETSQQKAASTPADESLSLRQLAQAVGPNQNAPATETTANTEKPVSHETAQKTLP